MFSATLAMSGFVYGLVQYNKIKANEIKVYSKTTNYGFQVLTGHNWEKFYIKGINIGAATPGKWFTEFPSDENVYLDWFEKIGQMNANCVRIYTLLPPEFYSALNKYNSKNSKAPLWLLQEIWPEENPEGQDYLKEAYESEYKREIELDIDAIHGNANIPKRQGRAYGIYNKDVSRYVLGYLVGRELEPDEVIATNSINKGFGFKGEYLSSGDNASPSEAWLAMNCDYVLKYEESKYKYQHPVAVVSWPTLDVQEHDSEWNTEGLKSKEYNDKVSIDINHINTESNMKAGFFGAYHIYPNYPDFMNNEPKYNDYSDSNGRLRYGGYLKEFIAQHTKYPALVAEFGLPTGMGNAHTSPDGLNHGGLTEEQQGNGIVRMMEAIHNEGYAGGVIFEWMDEWAKKTWITQPFMIPYDRHAYWHNAMDPEQNYGIFAMESVAPKEAEYVKNGNGAIKSIALKHDASYLYIDINLSEGLDFKSQKLLVGLDTYDRSRGEFKISEKLDVKLPFGLEFLLDINGKDSSRLLVHPGYNISKNKYSSYSSSNGIFEEIRQLVSNERVSKDGRKIEAVYQDESMLVYGDFIGNAYNHICFENNLIHIRIPWGKLNFTDPSSLNVLDDSKFAGELTVDKLATVQTEGILVSSVLVDSLKQQKIDMLNTDNPFTWGPWDTPTYKERLKRSYFMIQDYFGRLK